VALEITFECINCVACVAECPNEAISEDELICFIDPQKCTECVGHFDTPQCREVCPLDCIPINSNFVETKEQLMDKYTKMHGVKSKEVIT